MCALPGPLGSPALPPLPLFLLCLLAAARPSVADGISPGSPFTSLPAREEMMAEYSNLSLETHNITLTEHSSVPVEKNITLERSSNVELTCQFTTSGNLNAVNVTWKKNDEVLQNNSLINTTGNILYTQYKFTVISSNQMGSYSCFFGEKKEHRGTFHFKGPVNIQMSNKFYVINGTYSNETKLKIMQLSEEDRGPYWCHAVFQLDDGKEFEQIEQLKSDDSSNGIENNAPRHRKNSVTSK